jgi:hypothetical protein
MVHLYKILTPGPIKVLHEEPANFTFQTDVVLNGPLKLRLTNTVVTFASEMGDSE